MTSGIWLDVVDSTLDDIHARAAAGAEDGTWVVAAEQRAGRGSRGRDWHSGRGGLWLSVLRRGSGKPGGFELLSLRAGMAVARVLDGLPPVAPVMLKWPNDLMVHGRKVGGLLAEARWQGDRLQWVAIGLGLNVSNEIPQALTDRATTLSAYCSETTVEALAEPLARALGVLDLEASRLSAAELAEYARRDWLLGQSISTPMAGTASGIGEDGRLAIRDSAGRLQFATIGDVAPG
jgi:BirA family biotin operon repressor/biotin-[acetyl-CoA-carboxylase] ligase